MKKQITMVQYGCGKMSKWCINYALEKGVKVIGAFDIDDGKIGKDVMEIFGDKTIGVEVKSAVEFNDFLKYYKPDIAVVTTMSLLRDVYDALKICAENGVNAITTCEEAFYPQNSNPALFDELNKIAKHNGCTICGSGYQDVFWGNLITSIAGATHKILKIKGKSSYNVEDYGIALARAHGAGLSLEDFEKEVSAADNITAKERTKLIESGEFLPSYMWNVNGWLCSQLGLNVVSQTQKCIPQVASEEIYSTTLEMTIPKGYATGMSAVVTTQTMEGVVIESQCIGKVYSKDEFDCNEWEIEGEPSTQVTINRPSTVELTCATVINRLPEVISAPSGYYTTEKMPPNFYKSQTLEKYL